MGINALPAPSRVYNINDFSLKETIGTGSFAKVVLARNDKTCRHNALKIMKKRTILSLKQADHILNEIQILSKFVHPFAVILEGQFQNEHYLFMVLEFIRGGELFTLLRKKERLCNSHACFYAMEVVLLFERLHHNDIIYRDLKPENVLLTEDGHLKITDFGFAKQLTNEQMTFTLCGTPEYLAPEMIRGSGHAYSVDWWTLGILCFEMLAGYPPFNDKSPFGIYEKILKNPLQFPQSINSKAKSIIKKLLNRDLTKRLGCTNGRISSVKNHKWFTSSIFQWEKILNLEEDVPYIPILLGVDDTTHFDDYSDSDSEDMDPISEEDQALFVPWHMSIQ